MNTSHDTNVGNKAKSMRERQFLGLSKGKFQSDRNRSMMPALQRLSRKIFDISQEVDTIRDKLHEVQTEFSMIIRNSVQSKELDTHGAAHSKETEADRILKPTSQHPEQPPSKRAKQATDAKDDDGDMSDENSLSDESSFEEVLASKATAPKQVVPVNRENKSQLAAMKPAVKRTQGGQVVQKEQGGQSVRGGQGGHGGQGGQGKATPSSFRKVNLSRQAILDELNLLGKRILDIESLRIIVDKYGCSKEQVLTKMQVSRLSEMWDE